MPSGITRRFNHAFGSGSSGRPTKAPSKPISSAARLRTEALTEWFDEAKDPQLAVGADECRKFPVGSEYLPTCYDLRAKKLL